MIRNSSQDGFTAIEFMVVVAVVAIAATVGFYNFSTYRSSHALNLASQEITAVVRATRLKSISQEEGKVWGIRFSNLSENDHRYEVFKGSVYATSGVDSISPLRAPVRFGNPSTSSTYDMVFAPLTGALTENKILTLVSGSKGLISDLVLRTVGAITARNDYGVVGYWHLDEGTATTTYDASGNGNTGTLMNGPTWQSGSSCKAGQCLSFNGSNNYVATTLDGQPSALPNTTWEAWVYPTRVNFGTRQQILSNDDGFYDRSLLIESNTSNWGIFTGVGVWQPATVDLNQWQFVAVTWTPSNIYFYKNGVEYVFGSAPSGQGSNYKVNIGRNPGHGEYFQGRIDEVRIYNRALSANEILMHYNDLK